MLCAPEVWQRLPDHDFPGRIMFPCVVMVLSVYSIAQNKPQWAGIGIRRRLNSNTSGVGIPMLEAVLRYGLWFCRRLVEELTRGACGHLRSNANRTYGYFAHPGELTEIMQTRRLNCIL